MMPQKIRCEKNRDVEITPRFLASVTEIIRGAIN